LALHARRPICETVPAALRTLDKVEAATLDAASASPR